MIPKYESHHPVCLDVEWLLPTLFDASLLTFEPPSGGSFFGLSVPFEPAAFLGRFGPPALLSSQGFSRVKVNDTLPARFIAIGVMIATSEA